MGLNDVSTEQKVDVAHIIDIDVVEKNAPTRCADNAPLPGDRAPAARRLQAEGERLEDYFDQIPGAARARRAGPAGLVQRRAAPPPIGDSPEIGVRFFSSEAAMNILGEMGVKKVRTLGIDGGTDYSTEFSDLTGAGEQPARASTRSSASSRTSSPSTASTTTRSSSRCASSAGCDESQIVAARVLEYSIRKHASRPVRFYPMLERADAGAEGSEEPRPHRASRSAASTSRSSPATRAARSTSTRTCRCSATSPSSGTSPSTAPRSCARARTSRRTQWKGS